MELWWWWMSMSFHIMSLCSGAIFKITFASLTFISPGSRWGHRCYLSVEFQLDVSLECTKSNCNSTKSQTDSVAKSCSDQSGGKNMVTFKVCGWRRPLRWVRVLSKRSWNLCSAVPLPIRVGYLEVGAKPWLLLWSWNTPRGTFVVCYHKGLLELMCGCMSKRMEFLALILFYLTHSSLNLFHFIFFTRRHSDQRHPAGKLCRVFHLARR